MNAKPTDLEPVGIICDECGVVAIETGHGWVALLTDDDPPDVVTYCPDCAEHESGAT